MFKYNSVYEFIEQLIIAIVFWIVFYGLIYFLEG